MEQHSDNNSAGHLDKVREILFGEQTRAADQRFAKIEAKLAKELARAQKALAGQIDKLEKQTVKDLDTLGLSLDQNWEDTEALNKEAHSHATSLSRSVGKRVTALKDENAKSISAVRQQLREQSKALRDEFAAGLEELSEVLEAEIAELRSSAVDRKLLSGLLTELAAKLGSDQPS